MIAIGLLFVRMLCDRFKPRAQLEAEILMLRHQLNVLQQRTPRRRLHLRWIDRALFIWLYRRYPRILDAMSIVRHNGARDRLLPRIGPASAGCDSGACSELCRQRCAATAGPSGSEPSRTHWGSIPPLAFLAPDLVKNPPTRVTPP